jgi:DnaJ-class molecular chaperone
MQFSDYCQTLEVELSASANEIRRSYRRLARKYHPDISTHVNGDKIFKDVSEAYAGLKHMFRTSNYKHWQEPSKLIEYATETRMHK